MRKRILIFLAGPAVAYVASGDVVRQCAVPASACGEQSLAPGVRLELPAFDGARISPTLGSRTSSVTGFPSYGAKSEGAIGWNATVVETAGGDSGKIGLSLVGTGGSPARAFGWGLAVMQVPETVAGDTF